MNIVGFTGYARSGKSTAAEALRASAGYTILSFADPIKELLVRLDPPLVPPAPLRTPRVPSPRLSTLLRYGTEGRSRTLEQLKSDETFGPALRVWLQNLGVGARTVLGPDVWVNALLARWADLSAKAEGAALGTMLPIVIPDVRFPNERDAIHRLGGRVIRIVREGTGPANDHVSELPLDHTDDAVYQNEETTIEEFQREVMRVVLRSC